jgi:hypothetical protein
MARGSGWLFGAITVAPAILLAAWLLPALPLLLAGRFAALPMVFMFAPLAVGIGYFAFRRLPASWPGSHRDGTASVPWWSAAATVAVAVAFAAWQIAERTQDVVYPRDPVTYLQVAYWIAHHGSLPIPQSLAAFGGAHPGLSFASVGYFQQGTGIVPEFMTGTPLVVAAAIWLGKILAAFMIMPVIGGCAVLSFGGLAGRLVGPRWAPAAAAVLALTLPEQYTSRGTFSEPMTQVLLFGGLCPLIDSLVVNRRPHPADGIGLDPRTPIGQDLVLAALGGLALGLTVLIRIDGVSDILPAIPFLGALVAGRRRQAVPFAAGLVVGVGYGLADGYLLSRPYLVLEASSLRPLALITAIVLVLTAVAVAVAVSPKALAMLRRWRPVVRVMARWLPAAAAAVVALVFIGFAVRPALQTVTGETNPISIGYVAELQKLAGLPVNGQRQYYEDSLYWVIWYIGAPGVLLGAFGLAVLARRGVRALLTWTDRDVAARVWALPLMMAIWVIVTVLWRPAVTPDQPWASRRLVPFALPGLILGAIWASNWLKDRAARVGHTRATAATAASCCVASLVIPTVLTTLDIGVTQGPNPALTAQGMAFRAIGTGEPTAVKRLCAAIGPDASAVVLDAPTADQFAQAVRGICGTPTAVLNAGTTQAVDTVVSAIARTGRRPVLLAEQQSELSPFGGVPRQVVNLLTTQEPHNLTSPPTRTWLIQYSVWLSAPAAAPGGPAA